MPRIHNTLFLPVAVLVLGACAQSASGSGLGEAEVRHYFQQQLDATRRYDARAVCDGMAADYRQVDITALAGKMVSETYDKARACASAGKSFELFRQLDQQQQATGGVTFDQRIEAVELLPDRKSARVRYGSRARVGGRTLLDSQTTETVVERDGRLLSIGGESHSKAFP